MAARRKAAQPSPTRASGPRLTLGEVREGHFAILADGARVRRCPNLNGWPLVRGDGAPYPLPATTPVLEAIAPSPAAVDHVPVADPLAGGTGQDADLFHAEADR